MVATLTVKGQITIPVEIRQRLGLRTGDRLEFVITDEKRIEMIPAGGSVRQLRGMVPKPKKALSLAEMDRAIRAGRAR